MKKNITSDVESSEFGHQLGNVLLMLKNGIVGGISSTGYINDIFDDR